MWLESASDFALRGSEFGVPDQERASRYGNGACFLMDRIAVWESGEMLVGEAGIAVHPRLKPWTEPWDGRESSILFSRIH